MASCYEHCNKPYGFIEDGNSLNQPNVKNVSVSCCYLVWIRYREKTRGNILIPANLRDRKMTIDTSIVALLCLTFPLLHILFQTSIYGSRFIPTQDKKYVVIRIFML